MASFFGVETAKCSDGAHPKGQVSEIPVLQTDGTGPKVVSCCGEDASMKCRSEGWIVPVQGLEGLGVIVIKLWHPSPKNAWAHSVLSKR